MRNPRLRLIADRVRALTGQSPPTTGAIPIDPPLTSEMWQEMLATEARLLADQAEGRPLSRMQADILWMMPILRDGRQRIADAAEGKPFEVEFGIDVQRELADKNKAELAEADLP
jgi:hypothetical protein